MGQKSNPNSFNLNKKKLDFLEIPVNNNDYNRLLYFNIYIKNLFKLLFLKNKCFLKNVYIFNLEKKKKLLIYISFLPLKSKNIKKITGFRASSSSRDLQLYKKLFLFLKLLGYKQNHKIIFHNLTKFPESTRRSLDRRYKQLLKQFNREPYYDFSIKLLYLLLRTRHNSTVFVQFISRFFKLLHRSKKIIKFFSFLRLFSKMCIKHIGVNGIKIQIRGRFRGASRSKVRIIQEGTIPLQTIDSPISYSLQHVTTNYGVFGIKVWLNEKKKKCFYNQKKINIKN